MNQSTDTHELEKQLIIDCSQTELDLQQKEKIRKALENPLDWQWMLKVASQNGLLPLVCWSLKQNFGDQIDPEIKTQLTLIWEKHTRTNFFLTQKLVETVKTLNSARIAVLPFKGPTLAMQAYKNLALRQYCDLDILVQPKQFDKAVEILSEKGLTPIGKIKWLKRNLFFFSNKKDVVLVNDKKNLSIELHWKLSGAHFSLPLEISSLWERLETLKIAGVEMNVLPFKDLFVYLCLHGSRHAWEKFSWICDLHELIISYQKERGKINWTEIFLHARKHGCEKVLELGLFLVNRFYGLELDYPNFETVKKNESYGNIAEQVIRRNFSMPKTSNEIGDWYFYHLLLKERKFDRIKLHLRYIFWYLKIIFRPNSLDKSVFHLPTLLYPLYLILRPFRLLLTYGRTNSKRNLD